MKKIFLLFCSINFSLASSYIDLGKNGNNFGYNKYISYTQKQNHCLSSRSENPRVIVTGFGNWKKDKINVSSSVLDEVAKENILLTQESFYGETFNKTILINNKNIDICFIKLAVTWDVSSSILIYEAQNFNPDLVIMMGDGFKGKLMVETKARNTTAMMSGFDYKGSELNSLNTPRGFSAITGKIRSSRYMNMNLNYEEIEKELLLIQKDSKAPFEIQLNNRHLKSNSYICNALSYTFLQAINNSHISLFKKKLKIYPKFEKKVKAGFFHLPSLDTDEQTTENLSNLGEMIKKVIEINI